MTSSSAPVTDRLVSDVAEIKRDVEQILPSLVEALKRNRYFEEMQGQLRRAERVADAWRQWPLVVGVHDVLLAMRAMPDHDQGLAEQLADVLYRAAGVEEFGFEGEDVDPTHVEVTSSTGSGDRLVVAQTQRPGLRVGHSPIRKAIVTIERRGDPT